VIYFQTIKGIVHFEIHVFKSCLIWTSLCMLFEVVTIDLNYTVLLTDKKGLT